MLIRGLSATDCVAKDQWTSGELSSIELMNSPLLVLGR